VVDGELVLVLAGEEVLELADQTGLFDCLAELLGQPFCFDQGHGGHTAPGVTVEREGVYFNFDGLKERLSAGHDTYCQELRCSMAST
jgi:hypothetical protein